MTVQQELALACRATVAMVMPVGVGVVVGGGVVAGGVAGGVDVGVVVAAGGLSPPELVSGPGATAGGVK